MPAVRVEVSRAQMADWLAASSWEDVCARAVEAEVSADGVVVNTFYVLEAEFIECLKTAIRKLVWPIGLFSICNEDIGSKSRRGKESCIDEWRLLSWLDSTAKGSVVYINFCSIVSMKALQVIEIGRALEVSSRPFIRVVKESNRSAEVERWMSEGFNERTREMGLVITGWAPQMLILSHPSVGGFMTDGIQRWRRYLQEYR